MRLSEIKSEEINRILKDGGVICFVTDTVWGLGCLPDSEKGVKKIYEIKHRDTDKPLILMSNEAENLYRYVKNIPESGKELTDKFFPGALTLVCEKSDLAKDFITSGTQTVGIRVPDNRTFAKLCSFVDGNVLATTSANISGEPPATDYKTAVDKLSGFADIIFEDDGETAKGIPSTVVSVTADEVRVLRKGSVDIYE